MTVTPTPERSRIGAGYRVRPADDWPLLRTSHANMLVSGPRHATRAFIEAITPHLYEPVHEGSTSDAPSIAPPAGTLIIRDVDAFDRAQQQRLLRWLDDVQNSHTQVIALTTTRLYDLVQAGTFLDQLYYRLNVIQFDVIAGADGEMA